MGYKNAMIAASIRTLIFVLPAAALFVGSPEALADNVGADKAIASGIEFLLSAQRPEGSWWDGVSAGKIHEYAGSTSLVMLALKPHAKSNRKIPGAIDKSLEYLLKHQQIQAAQIGGGSMDARYWNYAYALIGMTAAHREKANPGVKAVIEKLIDGIVKGQNGDGSWTYQSMVGPMTALTSSCLIALVDAKNAGFKVPPEAIKKAVEALRRVRTKTGTFFYKTNSTSDASGSKIGSCARNPGNELALYLAGESDAAKLTWAVGNFFQNRAHLDAARKHGADNAATHVGQDLIAPYYYLYGYFYALQTLLFLDKNAKVPIDAGDAAKVKNPKECIAILREEVLKIQRPNGSWRDSLYSEDKYGAALAIMILNETDLFAASRKKR